MSIEVEAKFLHVDHESVRASLKSLGAKLEHPMRLMRRDLFDYPDARFQKADHSRLLRIRDEGDKATITYKNRATGSNYAEEIETAIGSYDDMRRLLIAIGLEPYSYQESKRETWHFDNVEVVLDEWPWLDPYIEIEGESETDIQEAADRLGFKWEDARFGSVDTAYYAQYPGMKRPDSIGDLREVKFDLPVPDYLKERM